MTRSHVHFALERCRGGGSGRNFRHRALAIGEFEGAFLPCIFWPAHALARAGRCDDAETILRRCEAVSGDLGLFAEEIDARRETFLGNTPLLFSHVEYVRAVMQLNEARRRTTAQPNNAHS